MDQEEKLEVAAAAIHFTCNIHASLVANTIRYTNYTGEKYGVRSTFALAAGPKSSLAQSVELHFRLQTHARTLSRVATGPHLARKSQGRAGQGSRAARLARASTHFQRHLDSSFPFIQSRDAGEALACSAVS